MDRDLQGNRPSMVKGSTTELFRERDRQEQMESWGARRGTLHLEKERWPPLTY